MMRNTVFASKCMKYLEPSYFESENLAWFFEKIKERFEETGNIPGRLFFEEEARKLPPKESKIKLKMLDLLLKMKLTDIDYMKDQLIDFVKRNIFFDSHEEAAALYNEGKTNNAYDITMGGIERIHEVSFDEDKIVKLSDFDKISIEYYMKMSRGEHKFPTNIKRLDRILGGGLSRGEVGLVQAEAKKGKSIFLLHCGFSCVRSFAGKVAHFILEGTKEQCIFRYQARLAEYNYHEIKNNTMPAQISTKLSREYKRLGDRLRIIEMSDKFEYTVLDIIAEIKEMRMRGFFPDMVIVDYADLLSPRKQYSKIATDNYAAMKWVYRDLKVLAMKEKIAIWTASQSQRPKKEAWKKKETKTMADIADSIEKVRVIDFLGSLNQTQEEEKAGIIRLYADVYRDGKCSKSIPIKTDFSKMIFYSMKVQRSYAKERKKIKEALKLKKKKK